MGVDREELERRGIWDPDAPDAEGRLAMIQMLVDRGAGLDLIEQGKTDLNVVSADLSLRGTEPRLTLGEVAELAGIDLDDAVTLLRALGFPQPPTDARVFTRDEAEMFRFFGALDMFGPDVSLQLVRVMGSSLARLADAIVATLRLYFETPLRSSGVANPDVSLAYKELSETLLPQTTRALDLILRRWLVHAGYQSWRLDPLEVATTSELAVGFADMVGFTALARSVPTAELVTAIGAFEAQVVDLVTDRGGRVVKLIGDEVMFVIEDPSRACRLALELAALFDGEGPVLPLRVGLAFGEVLTRDGDYYGPVVNTASRLVELAEPSGVVVSENVHALIDGQLATEALPPTRVKGYDEPVQAHRLRPPR